MAGSGQRKMAGAGEVSVSGGLLNCAQRTASDREEPYEPGIRRDRRRRTLRRVADGDAARAQGLPGAAWSTARRSRATRSRRTWSILPGVAALERWGLLDARSSQPDARRSTPTRSTSDPSRSPERPGRTTTPVAYSPAADRAGRAARGRRFRRRRRGSRGIHRREPRHRGRPRRRHSRPQQGRQDRHRARQGRHRRRRPHSLVADAVGPEQYNEKPPLQASYYTYWSGLPMDGRFETYSAPARASRRGRRTTT